MDYSQNIDPDTQQPYDVALYYWLEAAKRNGLAPMIALDQGTGRDPDSGQADPGLPKATQAEPWAVYDYYCGMYWLMNVVNPSGTGWKASDGSPLIATQWEVFNEPDRYDGAFTATDDGNAWIWADLASEAYSGETVGALTMSSMCDSCVPANQSKTAYVQNFISYLRSNGDPLPGTYSLHDYMDVDTDAYYQTADPAAGAAYYLNNFKSALSSVGINGEPIWITEAGVRLNDPNYSLGQYLDGNGLKQAWGAQAFKMLVGQSQVTEGFWYEFQTYDNNNHDYDSFDSAPVAADGSGIETGNSGNYALFRPSYCVLTWGWDPGTANGNSACHDTLGFTGPAEKCGSIGPFNQPESQISEPADIDWEDPCNG